MSLSTPITVTVPQVTVNTSATTYTISNGGAGGGSAVYSYNPNTSFVNGTYGSNTSASLVVQSDATIHGKLKVQGKDILEMMTKIEERLAILHPNPELEERWEELKMLSKRYRELEAEIIEKEKVWAILKK